jgi:hypothetical protein
MEKQLDLFRKTQEPKAKSFTKEYYLKAIAKDECLWDMRAWNKLKDPIEVEAWVDQETPEIKNCGHVSWCIMQLKILGIAKEEIINVILSNPKVTYSRRLVPCMLVSPSVYCERYKEVKCYGEICQACR